MFTLLFSFLVTFTLLCIIFVLSHLQEQAQSSLNKNDDKDLLHEAYRKAWQTLHYVLYRIKTTGLGLFIYFILLFSTFYLSYIYVLFFVFLFVCFVCFFFCFTLFVRLFVVVFYYFSQRGIKTKDTLSSNVRPCSYDVLPSFQAKACEIMC